MAVSVAELPEQIEALVGFTVILQTGLGFTVKLLVQEVVQPNELVTVTVKVTVTGLAVVLMLVILGLAPVAV